VPAQRDETATIVAPDAETAARLGADNDPDVALWHRISHLSWNWTAPPMWLHLPKQVPSTARSVVGAEPHHAEPGTASVIPAAITPTGRNS
jgi:hypothetical protein